MRYMTLLVLHVIVFLTLTSAAQAAVVPQFVLGGGYDFVIMVANKTNGIETVEFNLLEGFNQAWSAPFRVNGAPHAGNLVRVTLNPHSAEKLRLTGGDQPHVGYLRYEESFSPGSFVSPLVIQFFYEFRREGKLIDSIGAPEGLATWGTNSLAFPVERSRGLNTGIAVAPWSPPGLPGRNFSYTLRLFDRDGNQVGRETVTFDGHDARYFDQFFSNLPEEFLGWLSIEVSSSMFEHVCVTVLRLEMTPNGFQLTNVPPDFGLSWQFPW